MKEYIVNSEEECLFYKHDELIRCKGCKHWEKPHGWNGWCCKNGIRAEADDFCSWAERKEP